MSGSKSVRGTIGKALLFGLLGGCFATFVSAFAVCVFWFAGLLSPALDSTMLYLLLAIFGVSSVIIFAAVSFFESFLRPVWLDRRGRP